MYYYIDSSEKQTFISLHDMTVTNVVTIKNLHVYPKPGPGFPTCYITVRDMINHCINKHITLLSDTDIFLVCLIYLLILICLLGDGK